MSSISCQLAWLMSCGSSLAAGHTAQCRHLCGAAQLGLHQGLGFRLEGLGFRDDCRISEGLPCGAFWG